MENNNWLFFMLPLLKYFSKNNIIIQHKWMVFSADSVLKDLTWRYTFSSLNTSDLKIIISRKDLKWEVSDDELNYPIFPPINSKYYNNYLKILDITWSQINLFVYEDDIYNEIKNNSLLIKWFYFVWIDDVLKDYINKASWKIDSYLNWWNYHDYMDLFTYTFDISLIYKLSIKNNDFVNRKNIIIHFFNLLEKTFWFSKVFSWDPWNKNITKKYVWIARVLDRDNLKVKKDYYNNFDKWDIVIANNTSVHFMEYILKSWWIVTINNNKLSHASIVSRELWLPLVLWVRDLFFKVFDWDLIELDSLNWEVKILKRFREVS